MTRVAPLFPFLIIAFFVGQCSGGQGKPELDYKQDGTISYTQIRQMHSSPFNTMASGEPADKKAKESAPTNVKNESIDKVSHATCAYRVRVRDDVYEDYDNNDLPATELMCMCGTSGRGGTFVMQGATEPCVRTCMDAFHGNMCTDGFATEALFTRCCDSCEGNAGYMNALYNSRDWTPWACFEGEVPSLQCSIVVTERPERYIDGALNLLDGLSVICDCGSFGNGMGVVSHDDVLPCFSDCMLEFNEAPCNDRDTSVIYPEIARCCDVCNGTLGRQSLFLNGVDFRLSSLTCGISFTTPVPTASPTPMALCQLQVAYEPMGCNVGQVTESCSCPGKEWSVPFGVYGNVGDCFKQNMLLRDGKKCRKKAKTIKAARNICKNMCDGTWTSNRCLQKLS